MQSARLLLLSNPARLAGTAVAAVTSLVLLVAITLSLSGCGPTEPRTPSDRDDSFTHFEGSPPKGVSTETWKALPSTPGHEIHVKENFLACASCHNTTDYSSAPPPSGCVECHEPKTIHIEGTAESHCIACHEFKVKPEGMALIAESGQCLTCHSAATKELIELEFISEQAIMRISCQSCHKPHDPDFLIDSSTCLKCHAAVKTGEIGNPGHKSCLQCHRPHSWKAENTTEFCQSCHSKPTEVIEHLFPFHPKECSACHSPHTKPTFKTGECSSCHVEDWQFSPVGIPLKHKTCTTCHAQSDWNVGAPRKCLSCHNYIYAGARERSEIPSKHKQCLSCHPRHTWYAKKGSATCKSCHNTIVQVASKGKMQNCQMCHDQHEATFKGWESCAICHHSPVENAAEIPVKAACNLCHEPHTWAPAFPEPTTPELAGILGLTEDEVEEKKSQDELEIGDEELRTLKALASSKFCATCHADVAEATEESGMTLCWSCHSEHTWSPEVPSTCQMCHPLEVEKAELAPSGFKSNCIVCHAPHEWTPTLDCQSCHADIAETGLHSVPSHQSCMVCHGEHTWREVPRESCQMCHSERDETHYPGVACFTCHQFE